MGGLSLRHNSGTGHHEYVSSLPSPLHARAIEHLDVPGALAPRRCFLLVVLFFLTLVVVVVVAVIVILLLGRNAGPRRKPTEEQSHSNE